jgi:asparagine synthetase A
LRQITIGGTALIGAKNTYLTDPAKTLSGKGVKNRYGIDFYYNHWPFGITYEFVSSRDAVTTGTTLNDPKRDEIVANSHTATLFLSFGEQFVAGFRQQGRYDDWWPKTWQPFARFDYFDRDIRKDKKNDRIGVLTFGLNVFFAETTKFQLNYNIRKDESLAKDKQVTHEILAQLQFGF